MNPKNRTLIIVVGVIVAILGLAGIAVLAGGGDDGNSGVVDPSQTTTAPAGEVEQNRPISAEGTNIPTLDGTLDPDPGIGMAFPVISGQSFDGTPVTIGGTASGPTLIAYLAHWCPHCNREVPQLIELNNRGGVPADMRVVAVSTAVDNTAPNYPPSKWLQDERWPWETLADDANSSAFVLGGGSGFPYLVILDADGNIIARDSGEKTAEELDAWIQDALASTSA